MPETTRETLHNLVDQLPECAWEEANLLLLECLEDADTDMTPYGPMDAPEVPATPAEIAAIEEAYADRKAGRGKNLPHKEVVKYLLELP